MRGSQKSLSRVFQSFRYSCKPFYRRCALRRANRPIYSSANIPTIDSRIMVSHKHQYLFVRVPKCANTTILNTLWILEDDTLPEEAEKMSPESRQSLMRKQDMKKIFTTPSRLKKQEVDIVFGNYTKAIFVRNPFNRLASAYLYSIKDKEKSYRYGLTPNTSFAGFCDYLNDGGLYADIHWIPQSDICPLEPQQMDFIGYFETLSIDIRRLTSQLYNRSGKMAIRQHHKTSADCYVEELYTNRERRLVAETLYPNDFCFGYSPEVF